MTQASGRLTFVMLDLGADSAARHEIERLAQMAGGGLLRVDDPAGLDQVLAGALQARGTTPVLDRASNSPWGQLAVAGAVLNVALVAALLFVRRRRG